MDIQDYKKQVINYSDAQLIAEYEHIIDELSYDFVSIDRNWDEVSYNNYWKRDRPVFMEQRKVLENELSFRHINF